MKKLSSIIKPKNEILDNLELAASHLFPAPLPKEIKAYLKQVPGLKEFREDYLDATEGLIVRLSRCETFPAMGDLVSKAALPVKSCLWERFLFLKQFIKSSPEPVQAVPDSMGKFLREGLSALWHEYQTT